MEREVARAGLAIFINEPMAPGQSRRVYIPMAGPGIPMAGPGGFFRILGRPLAGPKNINNQAPRKTFQNTKNRARGRARLRFRRNLLTGALLSRLEASYFGIDFPLIFDVVFGNAPVRHFSLLFAT